MGVYRRKNKAGDYYGPWIIQYPSGVTARTGKIRYTSEKAGHSKRVADLAFSQKALEWDKKKHLGLETKKEYTFRDLVDWYLTLPKVKQKKSFSSDISRITILKEEFGNMNVRQIKPAMIETFQHNILQRKSERTGKKYAPATANRILEILKRIFNLAMREDMTEKNPCWKVSKLPENNKRDKVISHEEFQIIIKNLPKYAADIVATAYYTGMRAGEIFNLTWKKVNLEQRYIALTASDTKTSEPRRIPLNDDLVRMFFEIRKVRHLKHDNVFTYLGKPVKNIKRSFNTACKQAGVEDFRFHDLRHTFNTNMRKAGVDRSIIMKITGHKTMSMFERYNTIDSDDALDAMKRYDGFLNRTATGKQTTAILLQAP